MPRIDSNLTAVLDAVIKRLREQLSLSDSTCFLCLSDDVTPKTTSDVFLTVSPDGGEFDQGHFDGGGDEQLTVEGGVRVTIHSTLKLDRTGHDSELLSNASRGVLSVMHEVLRALTGHDLVIDTDGNTTLRRLIAPRGFERPERSGERLGRISLYFGLSFDWELDG